MPTAATSANITSDVSSMAKPGTSKDADSEIEREHPEDTSETGVPTANASSESTSVPSGTSSNDVIPETSSRNDTESSSEQETLRRRRLQKFSAQLPTE